MTGDRCLCLTVLLRARSLVMAGGGGQNFATYSHGGGGFCFSIL